MSTLQLCHRLLCPFLTMRGETWPGQALAHIKTQCGMTIYEFRLGIVVHELDLVPEFMNLLNIYHVYI